MNVLQCEVCIAHALHLLQSIPEREVHLSKISAYMLLGVVHYSVCYPSNQLVYKCTIGALQFGHDANSIRIQQKQGKLRLSACGSVVLT